MTPLRAVSIVLVATLLLASCGGHEVAFDEVPAIAPITPAEMSALLESSPLPVMVNVWASWCAPCRSEAPLLRSAASEWQGRVRFLGIDVRDTQEGGRGFIAEYDLTGIEHRFDASGSVPGDLGGVGVPLTYFFFAGGDLAYTHRGVIDERTLVLWLDTITGSG